MTLGTANVRVTSSSEVSQDCPDPRAFPVSVGSQGRKVTKETLASTASLASQGSRGPLASSDFLAPKE